MKVDNVIELADGKRYGLLLESELTEEDYFLGVLLGPNDEPTNNYIVLEEVHKDGKTFIKKVKDPILLNQLLEDFKLQYDDMEEENAA